MRMSSFFIRLAYRSPGQVLLKLLQRPALSFWNLAPEVQQRDEGQRAEQEEYPHTAELPTNLIRGPASHSTETCLEAWRDIGHDVLEHGVFLACPRVPSPRPVQDELVDADGLVAPDHVGERPGRGPTPRTRP